jgi:2-keto-4-pentenoate hydratase/2-oxohepta-3-ene-1,7-dioic acid hydratase in catechol pathway
MGMEPPEYMKHGDTIECEIEGIGTLTNHIK